jgi:hypothetical protein
MKIRNIVTLLILAGLISGPVYAKNNNDKGKQLPQGLQMKQDRGEPLPPGWQKKLVKGEVMEYDIYRHSDIVIPIDSNGLLTVRIEGKLVRLYENTREIVDIIDSLN